MTRPARRKLLRRRVAVLAMAIAVPAMAAPQVREAAPAEPALDQAGQAPVLATLDPEFAAWRPSGSPGALPADSAAALLPIAGDSGLLASGSPARAFTMAGSFTDRLRAEECLAMAVYYEAASESDDGQRAVAQVVMNRMHHPSYPQTVCGVVFQGSQRSTGCQFSFTCDGSLARRPSVAGWNKARRIASAALAGYVFEPVGLATHYHTTAIYPYWAPSLTPVGTIGAHRFYRWGGTAGRLAAFSAVYSGGEPLPVRAVMPRAPADGLPAAAGAVPVAPSYPAAPQAAAPTLATAAATPDQALFPQSGSVREEYARSGTWLRQP